MHFSQRNVYGAASCALILPSSEHPAGAMDTVGMASRERHRGGIRSTAGDKHRLLKVAPQDGQEIIVDLGVPQAGAAAASFQKGDRIVAMGKPARINGKPVLFAATVAEMQHVGHTGGQSSMKEGAAKQPGSAEASATQRTASGRNDGYDAVIYLFETDNLAEDEFGVYDEDFAWETNDRTFDSWNDTEAVAWDDSERAHYDVLGYDDAGEEGIWDW